MRTVAQLVSPLLTQLTHINYLKGIPTTGVPITGLIVSKVTGSVEASATNIYILCGSGSCSGWTWSGVDVTGGKTSTKCENIPTGATC